MYKIIDINKSTGRLILQSIIVYLIMQSSYQEEAASLYTYRSTLCCVITPLITEGVAQASGTSAYLEEGRRTGSV